MSNLEPVLYISDQESHKSHKLRGIITASYQQRCPNGSKEAKMCQETIPIWLHRYQQPLQLTHFWCQIVTLPSVCLSRNQDTSDQATPSPTPNLQQLSFGELTSASRFWCWLTKVNPHLVFWYCTPSTLKVGHDVNSEMTLRVLSELLKSSWKLECVWFVSARCLTWKKYFLSEGSSSNECTSSTKFTSDSSTWLMVTWYKHTHEKKEEYILTAHENQKSSVSNS